MASDRFEQMLAAAITLVCLGMGFYLYVTGRDGGLFIGAAFPSAGSATARVITRGNAPQAAE